jgi:netrin-G3 ligand
MTTIADLKSLQIYTIKVQAFTQRGPGPLSVPVQVKTQQGVPGQPQELRTVKVTATQVQLNWRKPSHSRDAITGYEIYWNDTFTQQEYRRSIPAVESFTLGDLYPDTLYWVWVAGKSIRGEGAATPPIPVRTEQYGKSQQRHESQLHLLSSTFNLLVFRVFLRSLLLFFLDVKSLLTDFTLFALLALT